MVDGITDKQKTGEQKDRQAIGLLDAPMEFSGRGGIKYCVETIHRNDDTSQTSCP